MKGLPLMHILHMYIAHSSSSTEPCHFNDLYY